MAQVVIAFGQGSAPGRHGNVGTMACNAVTEYQANPTTSQASTQTGDGRMSVQITASGGAIWAAFGAAPTAAPDTADNHLILDGQTRDFGPLPQGWKAAVINDS